MKNVQHSDAHGYPIEVGTQVQIIDEEDDIIYNVKALAMIIDWVQVEKDNFTHWVQDANCRVVEDPRKFLKELPV